MNELEFNDKGQTVGPGTFPLAWNKKIRPLELVDVDEMCLTSEEPTGGNTPIVPEKDWVKAGLIDASAQQVDRKDMTGKHSPLLLPIAADIAFSAVSDYGLAKYGNRDTWMYSEPPEGIRRYLDAAIRHAKQHQQEGEFDSESGLPHIYSVLWNAAAAVWHYEQSKKR